MPGSQPRADRCAVRGSQAPGQAPARTTPLRPQPAVLDRRRRLNSSSGFAPIEHILPIRQPRVDSEVCDCLRPCCRTRPSCSSTGCARRARHDHESGVGLDDSTIRRVRPSSTSCGSWGRWSWSPGAAAGRATSTAVRPLLRRISPRSKSRPPDRRKPDFVRRLRAASTRDRAAHLAWGEQKMEQLPPKRARTLSRALWPDAPIKSGRIWRPATSRSSGSAGLRFGVGSAATNKILIRVAGPSSDPDDDVLLGGKGAQSSRRPGCLQLPASTEALRVIAGSKQLGRIRHDILGVVPEYEQNGASGNGGSRAGSRRIAKVPIDDSILWPTCPRWSDWLFSSARAECRTRHRRRRVGSESGARGGRPARRRLRQAVKELLGDMVAGWQEFRDSIPVERRHP